MKDFGLNVDAFYSVGFDEVTQCWNGSVCTLTGWVHGKKVAIAIALTY